jgi:basic membrane lipoprotein Med (substrate-binding protein (PBP1-ABC) superfamily)
MKRMNKKVSILICTAAALVAVALPLSAQTEVKEKPPMYSYVSNWAIPRAQWAEMDKSYAADLPILDKALAAGSLIGYGDDQILLHQSDGETHDDWWSSMSMAGLMNVLDQFYKSGNSTSSVLDSATKHWDNIYVSRYYDWKPGTWKGLYGHGSMYRLKADAPDDAVALISKSVVGPLMEKLLADGTIYEWEIDTEVIHTEAPGMFMVYYLCSNAECLDKVNAALRETAKANPLRGPAMGSMIDYTTHRDVLLRSNATYK